MIRAISSASVSGASGSGIQAVDSDLSLTAMKILVPETGLSGSASTLNVTRTLFKGNQQAISSADA